MGKRMSSPAVENEGATIDKLYRTERGLSAIRTLDEAMKAAGSFEETLGSIVDRVRRLVNTEKAAVFLLDPNLDELVAQWPAVGIDENVIRSCRIPLTDLSVAGVRTFLTGVPYMSNAITVDPAASLYWVRQFGSTNGIIAPIEVDQQRIGVLETFNKRGDFTDSDLELVSLLAAHLGILLQNATTLEKERQAVAKLQQLNIVIDQQREGLRRTLATHDELAQVVLDGLGFPGIVAATHRLLANPVAIEDRYHNLVGYYPPGDFENLDDARRQLISQGRSPRTMHEDPATAAVLTQLRLERRPIRIRSMPHLGFDRSRVVAPVIVSQEVLGYVSVLESNRELDEVDMMTVERVAIAVALQMMKEQATAQVRSALRGDLVAELLAGSKESEEELRSRAVLHGIDLGIPRAVLVVEIDGAERPANKKDAESRAIAVQPRVLEITERVCRSLAQESVVAAKGVEIIILTKASARSLLGIRTQLSHIADTIRAEVSSWLSQSTVSIGIGSICETLTDYPSAYRHARGALNVIRAYGHWDRTLSYDQAGIDGLIFDNSSRDRLLAVVNDTLGKLLDYDQRNNGQLVETLEQYLLHDCCLERTAESLHVHPNTLRYRLQRVEEINGIEVRTRKAAESRCNLQLALRIWRVFHPR